MTDNCKTITPSDNSICEGITLDTFSHEPYIYQRRILIPGPTNPCLGRSSFFNCHSIWRFSVSQLRALPNRSLSIGNSVSRIAPKNNSLRTRARGATNRQAQLLPGRITPLNENPPLGRSREAHQNEPESYAVRGSDVGRTDGRTDGRANSRTTSNGWTDGRTDGRTGTDGWTDGRMGAWTNGRTDGRTDRRCLLYTSPSPRD